MALSICDPEIFGVTHDSLTLSFRVEDTAGIVDAPARVRVDGELRAEVGGTLPHHVRIEDLPPDRDLEVTVEVKGAEPPPRDGWFPARVRTLPAPRARRTATFATVNDLHFGEPRFGGRLTEEHEYGDEEAGFPLIRAEDTEEPYWQFMNEDALGEIDAAAVDALFVKGDIADCGLPEQFAWARRTFARVHTRVEAFLGNHDYYGRHNGAGEVDGYALLGQPPAPRVVELGGWRLVLLETAEPGEHHGVLGEERLGWLEEVLREGCAGGQPTLLLMHHQPVPFEHRDRYPNSIGVVPEHSLRFFDLVGANPQVKGVLIGHTHRNRVRRYPGSGAVPFVEVNCTKDYPGGWAHYTLYEDGSFRQEVRRTATARALVHSARCRQCFRGFYRDFALGQLDERSFVSGGGG